MSQMKCFLKSVLIPTKDFAYFLLALPLIFGAMAIVLSTVAFTGAFLLRQYTYLMYDKILDWGDGAVFTFLGLVIVVMYVGVREWMLEKWHWAGCEWEREKALKKRRAE